MRTFLVILCVFFTTGRPAFAHADRIEEPRIITVGFKTRDSVIFTVSNSVVTAMSVRTGRKTHEVPPTECAKFRNIRFETVNLLWNGKYKSAATADYVYVQYEMGPENERRFGELPLIEIMFRNGKFEGSSITRKTAEDTWSSDSL